jgi:adenosine deaminase
VNALGQPPATSHLPPARSALIELHIHLEGAIPAATLWELIQRHGGDPAVPNQAALGQRLAFHDFRGFIAAWMWKSRWLRSADDLADAAAGTARAWAAQGLIYVEAHCSPVDFAGHGLDTAAVVTALRRGLDRVPAVEVALIVDLVRDHGPEHALDCAAEAAALRHLGVVAVGLGGRETSFPAAAFAPAFACARAAGLGVTVHAGETAGPNSIAAALDAGAQRIGHGFRAIEDDALVAHLVRERIHLEVCPTSNLRTGVVRRLADHPLPRLLAAGVDCSINSDDPLLFGADLAHELRLAQLEFGLARERIHQLQLAAAAAAFQPQHYRAQLASRLTPC